jgi:hypothetical protein
MMHKFRYCLNYFAVPCSEYPRSLEPSVLLSEWRAKKVDWVVFSGTDWQTDEKPMRLAIEQVFSEQKWDLTSRQKNFGSVLWIDVRE